MNNITDIASYALEELKKAGADKASCSTAKARKDEFNVEANKFTLLRTLFDDSLSLKALVGGRKGVLVVNKLDKDSIDEAVAGCIELAKSATPDDAEDIAPLISNQNFDQTIGGMDKAKLFTRSSEYLEQVKDEFPKIILEGFVSEFNGSESAYVNSNGVCFESGTENYGYTTMFTAKDGDKSSSFNYTGALMANLDGPFMNADPLHRQQLEESVKSLDTRMVDGKFTGEIIVTPTCPDLWQALNDCFLGDRALIEGTSQWKDALDTVVADSRLTIRTVPLSPDIVGGQRYTSDGFISEDMDIIKDGVLKSFMIGLYAANKTGKPRAKNTASNFEISPGDVSVADMIKDVSRGILLNRFSGGSPSSSGEISGVAKNSFLIENGKVTDAISETMVSFNVLDALKNITAISKERNKNGYNILPWVGFNGITISGK
ncbi:MAG: metallopeptidase TldD-related protein [Oscillospiraceae bacterium]|nr:metallopeptidase TldD-related protein [Oscillospiraceae bacterium]